MTRNFENTILSLLRGMDARMDGLSIDISDLKLSVASHDQKLNLIINILAEHSARHDKHDDYFKKHDAHLKRHDDKFEQIITGVIPEMEKRTAQARKLKNHERRINLLEST